MMCGFPTRWILLGGVTIAGAAALSLSTREIRAAAGYAEGAVNVQRKEYRQFAGKTHTFCGVAVTMGSYARENRDTCGIELYLGTPHWDPSVRIVIPATARALFSTPPEDFLFQKICVTGKVEVEGQHTQIVVTDPSQVEIIERKAVAPFGAGAARICGDQITPPKLTREVQPNYTRAAMADKVQGFVALEAVVTTEGKVEDVRVVYGLHPELDAEAMKALRKWQFRSALRGTTPVAVIVHVEMSFKLRG